LADSTPTSRLELMLSINICQGKKGNIDGPEMLL